MIRVGVMGGGIMGAEVAATLARIEGAQPAAVAEPDAARATRIAEDTGATPFADWAAMLDGGELDAVYVGLPHHLHAPAAIAAAERGLHVLMDKPLCNTLAEGEAILAACEQAGTSLMVGFSHRFHPELRLAKAALERGELGTPILAADVVVQGLKDTPAWYWSEAAGGGALRLQTHHCFDRMAWLLDSPVVAVRAESASPQGHDVDTVSTIAVRFANGALGTIAASFAIGYVGRPLVELVIQGTRGQLRIDTWRSIELETDTTAVVQRQERDEWLRSELTEFVTAIRDGRAPSIGGDDGMRALRCAEAALRSSRTGETVEVTP
jgi:predicted dehydrogenase